MDSKAFGGLALFSGIFAGLCGVLAWQDWRVYSTGTPNPVDVPLAALTTSGAGGNPHVHVTGLQFGGSYVVETKNSQWNRVWVPVLSDGRVRAVVKTFSVTDEMQLRALCSRPDVTGIVTNDLHSLGSAEVDKLRANYPGVDFHSLPIIEQGRTFPTAGRVWLLIGAAGVLLILTAALALLAWWAQRRQKQQAEQPASAPAEVPATPLASGEGLGALRRTFPTGQMGKSAIGGGIVLLLVFGAIAAMALAHTKPGELYAGFIAMGSLEMLFVLLIVIGISQLRDSAALYADGFVSRRRGKTVACRWDEVESVAGMVRVPTAFQPVYLGGPLVVRTVGGKTLRIGDVQDANELVDAVYQEALARLMPRALETIRRGESVPVGPLRFESAGIRDRRGRMLEWVDLEDVRVPRGKIVLRKIGMRSPWWTGSLAMPNAALLLDLMLAARRGDIG